MMLIQWVNHTLYFVVLDAFLRNLETYEITYPEALELDYDLTDNHRRLRRDVSDDRTSYYQVRR